MNVFYIDTSSSYLYLAILADNKLLAYQNKKYDSDLSKYTLVEIEKLFNNANIKPENIDKIIVVSGPGSFTGIRIGMTFAKIFAWSFKKDIIPITSLEAMAYSVNQNTLIVPIINARRGYVYAGIYENNTNIFENQYIKLEDLLKYLNTLGKKYSFVSNDKLFLEYNSINYNPDFVSIVTNVKDKPSVNPHLIEPTYLKLTEAEENLGNKNDN